MTTETHDETLTRRTYMFAICAIMLLAIAIRVWVVAKSEVPARDSISFIQYSLAFENKSFVQVLRDAEQPPGYPIAVLVASWPTRAFMGGLNGASMAMAAQVASSFFAVLLILPMTWLGAELVGRRGGLLAALLFQFLPSWVRITSDGLSESTFLFWSVSSLWLGVRALRTGGVPLMLASGLAAGCAYFTRPEGAELLAAIGFATWAGVWLSQTSRRNAVLKTAALAAGFAVFLVPFVVTTGRLTNKPTARYLLGDESAKQTYFGKAPVNGPLLASWWQAAEDGDKHKIIWSIETLIHELAIGTRYVGLALGFVGCWFWRRYVRNALGGWALAALAIMHSALLIRMSSKLGYLSERHTALIVIVGCYPAAVAFMEIAHRLARDSWSPDRIQMAMAALVVATALQPLNRPLHGNRAGHRAAGEWIANHASNEAGVCDPFRWSHYYAGRVFHAPSNPDPNEQYVVVEQSDNQHSRLPQIPEARAKAANGTLVYHWPESETPGRAQVCVYRWIRPPTIPIANRSSLPSSIDE